MAARSWSAMRQKCDAEGTCRVCLHGLPEAAHIIPRSRAKPGPAEDPRNCVPLCRDCHSAFDGRRMDLLPYLNLVEQAYAVGLVGLEEARRRITGQRVAA